MRRAERLGFTGSCTVEVGRLLRVLAAQCPSGTIGEIGAGCGVGTAWLAVGRLPGVPLLTVEHDAALAGETRELFVDQPNVQVIHDDWHAILDHGPFALLFADVSAAKGDEAERVLRALAPGGLLVLDDLTPTARWPPEWRGRPDPIREFWLNDPRLTATEVSVTPECAVILAVRRTQGLRAEG
jgi:predicted O-methyltransferase YrrM